MNRFQLHCLGISHHHASIETRERLRFSFPDVQALMATGHEHPNAGDCRCRFSAIDEMVLLSTCNRVELYVSADVNFSDFRTVLSELIIEASRAARRREKTAREDEPHITLGEFEKITYHYQGLEVARHLSRVACSLDSMVLGEMQILSQIKGAQEEARSLGFIGPVLSKVFATAHRVGKQARIQTAISCNSSSVSSAAVVLAKTHVGGDLSACDVTVVGIGEMGELALKTLHARGARRFHIVNRTIERANKIATHIAEYAGATCSAHGLDELSEVLARTDAVITAAGGGACIVNAETAARVMGNRSGRRLVVVDIGVPRNVDPKASAIEGFQLLDSDDIKAMQDDALESRRNEVPKVMAIIDEEMSRLEASLRKLCMQPLIDALRQKAEAIRQHELERTYHRLGSPDPVMWSHVQHFSEALVKKLFHDPTICIQEKAALESADFYAATIRELFGLNKER